MKTKLTQNPSPRGAHVQIALFEASCPYNREALRSRGHKNLLRRNGEGSLAVPNQSLVRCVSTEVELHLKTIRAFVMGAGRGFSSSPRVHVSRPSLTRRPPDWIQGRKKVATTTEEIATERPRTDQPQPTPTRDSNSPRRPPEDLHALRSHDSSIALRNIDYTTRGTSQSLPCYPLHSTCDVCRTGGAEQVGREVGV